MNEEELRRCLKSMGVDSLGIYVHNGMTYIALHCNSRAIPKDIEQFLSIYLPDTKVLL